MQFENALGHLNRSFGPKETEMAAGAGVEQLKTSDASSLPLGDSFGHLNHSLGPNKN